MGDSKHEQARGAISAIAIATAVGLAATMTAEPARAATAEECRATWEQAPAAQFCTTPTYSAADGDRCGIQTTCEARAGIITGVDDAGELVRTAPQSLGTVTLDSEGMFGTVPQWLLGSWNVCITAYGGQYGVELGFNPCETGYVSATDAATYGVPSVADWARRDEEALHGMVNNDPPGVLPVYGRDADTQTCIDRWITSNLHYVSNAKPST